MPFGRKALPDGREVDFDRIYAEGIRPALQSVGLSGVRADGLVTRASIHPLSGRLLPDFEIGLQARFRLLDGFAERRCRSSSCSAALSWRRGAFVKIW
jgi:hypothetical protein